MRYVLGIDVGGTFTDCVAADLGGNIYAGKAPSTPPKAVSPHWLRHAHCSHALDRSANPALVRDTAGHADLRVTSVYSHVQPNESSATISRGMKVLLLHLPTGGRVPISRLDDP